LGISSGRRLAAILPQALKFARLGRQASADQAAAAAIGLGGLFAWGIRQGRFTGELLGREIADACERASFPAPEPPSPPAPDITLLRQSTVDEPIIAFQAIRESGQLLQLLHLMPIEQAKLAADTKLIEYAVGRFPSLGDRFGKRDLIRLIEDILRAAELDHDLAAEVSGLRAAAGTHWFESPEVVFRSDDILLVTDVEGLPVETLPLAQRKGVHHDAVTGWARMLFDTGILIVTVRRDRLRAKDGRLVLTRWAGARRASVAAKALVRQLVLAAFDDTPGEQARARSEITRLLADGLGLEGSLQEVEEFCLALISTNAPLKLSRQSFSHTVVRESGRYVSEQRIEFLLLLRQLVWLRELGIACGESDLAYPWRELAPELSDGQPLQSVAFALVVLIGILVPLFDLEIVNELTNLSAMGNGHHRNGCESCDTTYDGQRDDIAVNKCGHLAKRPLRVAHNQHYREYVQQCSRQVERREPGHTHPRGAGEQAYPIIAK
jgi:hypothetical protein